MRLVRDGWLSQRRRVRRLQRFVHAKRKQELYLRRAARDRALDVMTRFETLVAIGATGAVWASRIRNRDEGEARRPITSLAAAALIVLRWWQLAGRFWKKGSAQ